MITALGALVVLAAPAQPARAPKDVVECLLSLPPEIGPFRGLPIEVRKKALADPKTIVDKKNGYVSFSTDWVDSGWTEAYTIQVAVFQRDDKQFIVGVTNSNGESLGDHSMIGLEFYRFAEATWTNVTSEVAPPLTMSDFWVSKEKPPSGNFGFFFLRYNLPREGTTIAVSLEVWIQRRVDDGQQDISTDADRARYEAIESAVREGSRRISLVWNRKKGAFTKKA